jgi:hypothetical protein
MSRRGVVAAALALAASGLVARGAPAAQCTVTAMSVTVRSTGLGGDLAFAGSPPTFPVTVDEAAGTIAFDLSGFPASPFTIVGVMNQLAFPPTTVTGTLDAGGNVTVRAVPMDLTTFFGGTPSSVAVSPDVTTGVAAVTVSGADVPSEGTPLDFTTGALHLSGESIVEAAPGAGAALSTGLDLHCTLSPVPNRDALPAAPSLRGVKGKAKAGRDAALGETLSLKGNFTQGAAPVDPAPNDLFVRVADAEGTVVLLRVPAGTLTARGKKLVVEDEDGTRLHVAEGRKTDAAVSGMLVLRRTKKGYKLALTARGLDLTTLGASGRVTLDVGPAAASDDVAVTRKGARTTLR